MYSEYPILSLYLNGGQEFGLSFSATDLTGQDSVRPDSQFLKYYYADKSTNEIINHNVAWAMSLKDGPIFQFAYLMLPTVCNQACCGCFMGQDKGKLPEHLDGPFFTDKELSDVLRFLKEHGAKAVVYGGGGELFTWDGAFRFIEKISEFGLHSVIFTNGTLLSKNDVKRLNDLGAVLIISIRDSVEKYHNQIVRADNFRNTLWAIEYAWGTYGVTSCGLTKDSMGAVTKS